VLNDALATEYMCALRYRFHYFMATGINSSAVTEEFMEHAREEQAHADLLAGELSSWEASPNSIPRSLQNVATANIEKVLL
jgi:bacterioferritin